MSLYWRNDWTGFFIVYFKWCYYVCVSPFRFEWDERLNKFRIEKNRLQSLVCASLYILLGFWYLKDLRKIPIDHLYKNPVVYFTLAFNLNAIYYHIGVLATSFWKYSDRFLEIVNFECSEYASTNIRHKLIAVFLCILFAVLPLLYSICGYSFISSSRIWEPSLMFRCLIVEGRFAFFLNRSAVISSTESCSQYAPTSLYEISILDAFLGVLAFLMETSRQIVGFYSDFFPLVCCLSLWASTGVLRECLQMEGKIILTRNNSSYLDLPARFENHQLHHQLHHQQQSHSNSYSYRPRLSLVDEVLNASEENSKPSNNKEKGDFENGGIILLHISKNPVAASLTGAATSAPVVQEKTLTHQKPTYTENEEIEGARVFLGSMLLKRYEVCKSFARTVNRALGQLLFAYVLSSIMYLSTCMDAVLVLQDWFGKLRVAFFFFIFILMFFIGSEIVNKVYGIRAWLSDPANNAFLPEKNVLVLIHEVTCKSIGVSGNGMFTITYSTFMTVMTTTVTFFIIILQFQKPRGDWEHLSSTVTALNASLHDMNTLISQLSFIKSHI